MEITSLLKGHILISLSCTYMNTPDAKAGGKGISWEAALALRLCQLCWWHFPNPGTAALQPMASTAGTCHPRAMEMWNILSWKESLSPAPMESTAGCSWDAAQRAGKHPPGDSPCQQQIPHPQGSSWGVHEDLTTGGVHEGVLWGSFGVNFEVH